MLVYEPDDQTIQVEAGTTLAELRAVLARNGQIFPLDVADPATETLAALVAGAADGPRRLAYGALRDLVLGLTVVECDGTLVRYGAQVVKNVTGYDLVKLMVGNRDTLGLIVAVSLRVFPRPAQSATIVLDCTTAFSIQHSASRSTGDFSELRSGFARCCELLDALASTRLQPVAVELLAGSAEAVQLVLKFEGSAAVVARHLREIAALAHHYGACIASEHREKEEEQLWQSILMRRSMVLRPDEVQLRLAILPSAVDSLLAHMVDLGAQHRVIWSVDIQALNGIASLRLRGARAQIGMFQEPLLARWQPPSPAINLMRAIKDVFDPVETLSPLSL
ncbi:FAD-binding oxidoreductase [Candidatus Gracilibacteria bacterium]|nr:FAD-binding oxidoreductase [Candidatus Gracilibacteria bacterium]